MKRNWLKWVALPSLAAGLFFAACERIATEPQLQAGAPAAAVSRAPGGSTTATAASWTLMRAAASEVEATSGEAVVDASKSAWIKIGGHALYVPAGIFGSTPTRFRLAVVKEQPAADGTVVVKVDLKATQTIDGREVEVGTKTQGGFYGKKVYLFLNYALHMSNVQDRDKVKILWVRPDGVVEPTPNGTKWYPGSTWVYTALEHFSEYAGGW